MNRDDTLNKMVVNAQIAQRKSNYKREQLDKTILHMDTAPLPRKCPQYTLMNPDLEKVYSGRESGLSIGNNLSS